MKRVLVTGGSRGIGAAAVRLFAAHGWQVIANYRCSEEQARTLAAETGCSLCRADVSEAEDRKKLLEFTENTFGGIDVLVNNAGISLFGLFDTIPADEVRQMYGVNLTGTVELCRLFLPQMLRRKSGCIVNVSSVWGISGASCEVDYSAAKAAVAGLTRALAREVGPSGVRVNCVAPGVIDTDMLSVLPEETRRDLAEQTPLGRLGRPEDIAHAVAFLASDKASFITGQVLGADGGFIV